MRKLQQQAEWEQIARAKLEEIQRREKEEDEQEAQRIQKKNQGGKPQAPQTNPSANPGANQAPQPAAPPTAEQQAAQQAQHLRYQQPVATLSSQQAEQLASELKGELSPVERGAVATVAVNVAFVGERKLPPGDFYRILVMGYRAVLKRRSELKVASLPEAEATKLAGLTLSPD